MTEISKVTSDLYYELCNVVNHNKNQAQPPSIFFCLSSHPPLIDKNNCTAVIWRRARIKKENKINAASGNFHGTDEEEKHLKMKGNNNFQPDYTFVFEEEKEQQKSPFHISTSSEASNRK